MGYKERQGERGMNICVCVSVDAYTASCYFKYTFACVCEIRRVKKRIQIVSRGTFG